MMPRYLLTSLDSILKSRDIILPTKICLVKAIVFPVVMYGCESWTIKKAGRRITDAFELWCWRRLLSVPWTARRTTQSILKEISPEYSLEGLMLKLKLNTLATWCEELIYWKRPWCWAHIMIWIVCYSVKHRPPRFTFLQKFFFSRLVQHSSFPSLLSLFNFLKFYWNIVDLQCCVNFFCTAK